MAAEHLGDGAVTTARRELCATIAGVVAAVDVDRPVLVAVDGRDGAGKTRCADDLADHVRAEGRRVQRIELDRFLQPRGRRHALGRWSPEGFFHDSYDLDGVERWVLGPLGSGSDARVGSDARAGSDAWGGSDARTESDTGAHQDVRRVRTGVYDLAAERARLDPEVAVPDDAVVVVDGMFLHRRRLRDRWDVSVFLQVDPAVSFARVASRDGTDPDPDAPANRRYRDGMRLYLEECDPASLATFAVDNRDFDAPAILSEPST